MLNKEQARFVWNKANKEQNVILDKYSFQKKAIEEICSDNSEDDMSEVYLVEWAKKSLEKWDMLQDLKVEMEKITGKKDERGG